MELLGSVPVGRVVFTRGALPAAGLVAFGLDAGDIVITTDREGLLAAAVACNQVVAFEADDLDYASRSGWTVTVVGRARRVTGTGELARLRAIGIQTWTADGQAAFVRLTPGPVTGRLLYQAD